MGCAQYQMYLIEAKFVVWTNHKPLFPMFNSPSANLSIRMERWMMRKQSFNVTVQCLPGTHYGADYLSGLPPSGTPVNPKPTRLAECYVNMIINSAKNILIPPEKIRIETKNDPDLQEAIRGIKTNKWHRTPVTIQQKYGDI